MRPIAAALALSVLAAAAPAAAWTDARPAGLVTELAVDRDGGATVSLRVRWRVLAGRFRTFDLADLPTDLALLEATATDATGNAVPVATRTPSPGRLELTLGEDGGLRRGALDVVVRYTTSLRAQGAIHRVGSDAVLEVATVPWERGLEATEVRVALPTSVERARWLADETPGIDATVTSELGRDVVHAVRRHVPPGARWIAHIACDPALFSWLDGPRATVRTQHQAARRSVLPLLALAAGLAAALGASGALLTRRHRRAAWIALPERLRALPWVLAGVGGAVQSLAVRGTPFAIAAGTAIAAAGLALALPGPAAAARAPSEPARIWPDVRVRESLPRRGAQGWRALLLGAAGAVLIGVLLRVGAARDSLVARVAALDLALVGLALAASARTLRPGHDAFALRGVQRAFVRRLRGEMARTSWRVRGDGAAPGAVRLRVVPRPGHRLARGVRALECAVAWSPGLLRWRATPVLIARVEQGAPLERALRLAATRAGTIEVRAERGELAWVANLRGPERALALREFARMLPEAIVPSPEPAAREQRVRAAIDAGVVA